MVQSRVERALERVLPAADHTPQRLHEAMRYAVLGGGKRVRPLLVFAAGELAGAAPSGSTRVACAVELIHAYSLVHDDLPCMDDDVLRRGKPTVHVEFGEATALLAGDALQALAFEVLAAGPARGRPGAPASRCSTLLAVASGTPRHGGRPGDRPRSVGKRARRCPSSSMHRLKTGALLRASVVLGRALRRGARAPPRPRSSTATRSASAWRSRWSTTSSTPRRRPRRSARPPARTPRRTSRPTSRCSASRGRKALAQELRRDAHAALEALRGARRAGCGDLADLIVTREF